jgi:hypothetical protein
MKPNCHNRRLELDLLDNLHGAHPSSPPPSPPREPQQPQQPPQQQPASAMSPTTSLPHDVAALTPPTDSGEIKWTAQTDVHRTATDSSFTDPSHPIALPVRESTIAPANGHTEARSLMHEEASSGPSPASRIDGDLDVLRKHSLLHVMDER